MQKYMGTSIRLEEGTKFELDKFRQVNGESYDSLIRKLVSLYC